MTEVLFFHRRSGTCLVGDLIQKHDEESLNTWEHRMMEGGGVLGRNGSTPRDWRLTFEVLNINHSPAQNILTGYRAGESGTLFQFQWFTDF